MLRAVIGISFGLFLASACGRGEEPQKAAGTPPEAKKALPAEPAPAPAKPATCFDDARWATKACAGDGQGPPQWWGPKRWPRLKPQQQRAFKDVDGRQHWSLTLVRGADLASAKSCVDAMKQSLSPLFGSVTMLPSSVQTRASFRAKSARHEVTVVCGISIKQQSLVNIDLAALPGTKS